MKKLKLTLIIAVLAINCFAQGPNWLWGRDVGGVQSDNGMDVATDVHGNVFVTGWFYSATLTFGSTTLTHMGGYSSDMFIVKYDSIGNVLWANSAGGTDNDRPMALATDAIGNVIVTGYFNSTNITFGTTTLSNANFDFSSDIFVAKYDPNGNLLWAQKAGGIYSDQPYDITVDANQNIAITGFYTSPTINFGGTVFTHTGLDTCIFLAKYDVNGNVLWAKSNSGTQNNFGNGGSGVSADGFGNIIVAGSFTSDSITFGTYTLFNSNFFITKYDVAGNVVWAKSSNGKGFHSTKIKTDSIGNTFVTGDFTESVLLGTIPLTHSAWGGGDIVTAKFDSNGNPVWAKPVGSYGMFSLRSNQGEDITTDKNKNVYLTGTYTSDSVTFGSITLIGRTLPNSVTIFVAKYDSLGNVVWAIKIIGSGGDIAYGITNDLNDNIYIAGWNSSDTLAFGPFNLHNNGYCDIFLAKFGKGIPQGIVEYDIVNGISVYPNPFASQTTITFNNEQHNSIIKVTDILGKEIKTIRFSGKQYVLEKGEMNAGIYFISVNSEHGIVNRKIIVQ